jgi:hypothetical protein
VHRGTPWQTVYLKANNILLDKDGGGQTGINTWSAITGDMNYYDASNSAPVQDRQLFDLFTTRFNDNAARGTLAVNVGAGNPGSSAGLAAWSALFSGMVAITNTTAFPQFHPQTNLPVIIQPAGPAWPNSALGKLVVGINNARATFKNADGLVGSFEHIGDILLTPQLTEASPFLNTNSVFYPTGKVIPGSQQPLYGISDEMYEWLPQQALGLLRASGTTRYVVYCYGQTLRPAAGGTVLSGNFFNLVTNYQITAESAARAVIRVDRQVTATGTNYSTVVESFNPLPPN